MATAPVVDGNSNTDMNDSKKAGSKGPSPYSDPVYKLISLSNGEVNRMTKQQMRERLANLHIDTRGVKEVLKKRLKNFYKKQKLVTARLLAAGAKDTPYDFLMVIDFEATCEENNSPSYEHEIIEFPVVLINTRTLTIESEFHEYCRPVQRPKLSAFCTELTGIKQETVDMASSFPEVLSRMENWMDEHRLQDTKYAVCTDGPWDMSRFLHRQCILSKLPFPRWGRQWVNVRKAFRNFYGFQRAALKSMLENLGLHFEGQPHSGIDDARNISRITVRMLHDGCNLIVNEKLLGHKMTESSQVVYDVYPIHKESDEENEDASTENGIQVIVGRSRPPPRRESAPPIVQEKKLSVREKQLQQADEILTKDENLEDLMFYLKLQNS